MFGWNERARARKAARSARGRLSGLGKSHDDPLEFIWDGALDAMGKSTELDVPEGLRDAWGEWEQEAGDWLEKYAERSPSAFRPGGAEAVGDDEMTPYNLYMTLTGEGVGIWDGRWDDFMTSAGIKKMMRVAKTGQIGKASDRLESLIYSEAAAA